MTAENAWKYTLTVHYVQCLCHSTMDETSHFHVEIEIINMDVDLKESLLCQMKRDDNTACFCYYA